MTQYFFNSNYFNLKYKGCSSTTWKWENLICNADKDGIVHTALDCDINIYTKIAKPFKFREPQTEKEMILSKKYGAIFGMPWKVKEYTGEEFQLI